MGNDFSEPVKMDPTLGYVGIGLRINRSVYLYHAPTEVIEAAKRIIKELYLRTNEPISYELKFEESYGVPSEEVTNQKCFRLMESKLAATTGKLFTIMMLEEMYKLGYDPVVSSDLSQQWDNATWFFVKAASERPSKKVVCLAPGKSDTLVLVRACNRFEEIVRTSIIEAWPQGIQKEKTLESCEETILQIKLNGNPWCGFEGEEEGVQCRQMLIQIIGQLGFNNFKLLFGTNIKGGTDSYFFIHDENYCIDPSRLSMISLNRKDRLMLINCRDMARPVKEAITRSGHEIKSEEETFGSWEFQIEGKPWVTYGEDAIKSRNMISRISEKMLEHGWALTTAIDISRSVREKSVLLYTKSENHSTKFACIALCTRNVLSLLDFSPSDTQALRTVIEREYIPGLKEEQTLSGAGNMLLKGKPWTGQYLFFLHARQIDVLSCTYILSLVSGP